MQSVIENPRVQAYFGVRECLAPYGFLTRIGYKETPHRLTVTLDGVKRGRSICLFKFQKATIRLHFYDGDIRGSVTLKSLRELRNYSDRFLAAARQYGQSVVP